MEFLQWEDYLILSSLLVTPIIIGLYMVIKYRKDISPELYLLAGRNASVIPVTLSLVASWISPAVLILDPVDIYVNGSIYIYSIVGYIFSVPLVAHLIAERIHESQWFTIFELMRSSYNGAISAALFVIWLSTELLSHAISVYLTGIAFQGITQLDTIYVIPIIGVICTVHTLLGGMKTILCCNVLHLSAIVIGIIACIIVAVQDLGGIKRVWKLAGEGGKLNFKRFDTYPYGATTFWIYIVCGFFRMLNTFIGSQTQIQQYMSLEDAKQTKLTVWLTLPLFGLITGLFWILGIVMFAFSVCNQSYITLNPSQKLIVMARTVFKEYTGLQGLFLAAMFSSCLSSVSPGITACAAVALKDLIGPIHVRRTGFPLFNKQSSWTLFICVLITGAIVTFLGLIVRVVYTSPEVDYTAQIVSIFGGMVAGVCIMMIRCSFVNSFSVIVSLLISSAIGLWISIGSILHSPYSDNRGFYISKGLCYDDNITYMYSTQTPSLTTESTEVKYKGHTFEDIYKISPMLYPSMGCILIIIFGVIFGSVSKAFSACRDRMKDSSYSLNSAAVPEANDLDMHMKDYISLP